MQTLLLQINDETDSDYATESDKFSDGLGIPNTMDEVQHYAKRFLLPINDGFGTQHGQSHWSLLIIHITKREGSNLVVPQPLHANTQLKNSNDNIAHDVGKRISALYKMRWSNLTHTPSALIVCACPSQADNRSCASFLY